MAETKMGRNLQFAGRSFKQGKRRGGSKTLPLSAKRACSGALSFWPTRKFFLIGSRRRRHHLANDELPEQKAILFMQAR